MRQRCVAIWADCDITLLDTLGVSPPPRIRMSLMRDNTHYGQPGEGYRSLKQIFSDVEGAEWTVLIEILPQILPHELGVFPHFGNRMTWLDFDCLGMEL